jgi:ornithine cyclodeaminase/alanine dehydrogenase-like protein (mu-crystallin family)
MLILSREDLKQALPMDHAMDAVAQAFAQLSSGEAEVPLRLHIAIPPHDGLALIMPAYLSRSQSLGLKALTLYPQNPDRHSLPSIQALVLLFDVANGAPLALMDGGYLTAMRTGAGSGVATRLLARPDARVLAVFGAGAQALPQAWAICVARPIEHIWIVNRSAEHAVQLAATLRTFGEPVPSDVRVASSTAEALAEADVICCATASPLPVFDDADIQQGAHINGVGSYRPTMQEIPSATVARARLIVDQRAAAWAEAGDLVIPRDQGLIDEGHIAAELGEIVLGRAAGRTDEQQITLFKSVGNAVQDVASAQRAYAQARALGLGVEVSL